MKFLTAVALAFLALQASWTQAGESLPADDGLLARTLARRVQLTGHAFYTFHYQTARAAGIPEGTLSSADLPRLKQGMLKLVDGFLNPRWRISGPEVPALHLAVDPVISRTFGGTGRDWLLYRLEFPKGMRVLNLLEGDQVSRELAAHLRAKGCRSDLFSSKFTFEELSLTGLFQGNWGIACRQYVVKALSSLGVAAIKYAYRGITLPGCRKSDSPGFEAGAYMLTQSDAIRPEEVRIFWAGSRDDSPEGFEKQMIAKVFADGGRAYLSGGDGDKNLDIGWPDSDRRPTAEMESWKRAHLINCQDPDERVNAAPDASPPAGALSAE